MIQTSPRIRLKSLDGIRGLAILAVFLNHIDPIFVSKILPSFLLPFSSIIFASGVLGVSFLFVLSGFLMAYIYPHPSSGLWFLQKRYTRIFPLFLTMATIVTLFRVFPKLVGLWGIGLILLFALIVHITWVYGVKKLSSRFRKMLFFGFLLIQVFAGTFYAFWIMRHPAIVFNQQLPDLIREGTIGLVNATLTLPLGNYIPMLDGVYWSLGAEVLFYILYPILCIPVINYLAPQKKIIKVLFLISLAPLIAGADLLSHHIFGLSMLQLPLFYCFVTGITLGYLYKNKPEVIYKIAGIFKGGLSYLSVIFFILVIFFYHSLLSNTSYSSWIQIIFAIPFALVIALALDSRNALSKMFSSKLLVFFGLISYSIYLSHSPVIHIVDALYLPITIPATFIYVFLIFIATIILSGILYILLERPYFIKPKEVIKPVTQLSLHIVKPAFIALGGLSLIYFFSMLSAYQSTFNFFSIEYPTKNVFISPQLKDQKTFSMQTYPIIKMQIKSQENNLGIIAMHVKHELGTKNTQNTLIFHIKEKDARGWYATTSYKLNTMGDGLNHPFGFPQISNSKGKTYDVELQLNSYNTPDYVSIDTSGNSIRTVYLIDKSQLLKNPSQFITFTQKKIFAVFYNREAQIVLFLFTPFFLLTIFLFLQRGLVNKKQ